MKNPKSIVCLRCQTFFLQKRSFLIEMSSLYSSVILNSGRIQSLIYCVAQQKNQFNPLYIFSNWRTSLGSWSLKFLFWFMWTYWGVRNEDHILRLRTVSLSLSPLPFCWTLPVFLLSVIALRTLKVKLLGHCLRKKRIESLFTHGKSGQKDIR